MAVAQGVSGSSAPEKTDVEQLPIVPVYAAVDIGSNKIRLALYGVNGRGEVVEVQVPEKTKYVCALAQGMSADNPFVKERNLVEAERALSALSKIIRQYKILPENVYAVGTAALRAVEKTSKAHNGTVELAQRKARSTETIKRLRRAFEPFSFDIISEEEEAHLVDEAARLDPLYQLTSSFFTPTDESDNAPYAAVASLGGASTEICSISKRGDTINPTAIPHGVHTLREIQRQSGGDATPAANVFQSALAAARLHRNLKILYPEGGAWRALGKVVCDNGSFFLNGTRLIRERLADAASRTEAYFKAHADDSVRERAASLALAAEALTRVVAHTGADKIVFLSKKLVDALAQRLHARSLARLRLIPSSQQLSSLSAPAPTVRV